MDYSFLPYFNTNLVGLLAILLFSYVILKRLRAPNARKAPEAAGGWPLIGHLRLLTGGSQLPHMKLGALADKYGPAFTIRVGVHPALVISTSELAKECFTTNDVSLCSRPKIISGKHFGYNYAMLAYTSYGPYWREIRKITSLELLSTRRLELLKGVKASEMETSLKELYNFWEEKKIGNKDHVLVDMKQWFGDLSLKVILRMVAGKRYYGTSAASDEARRCHKALREFFHLAGLFVVGDAIPYLGWLDLGGYEKAMKKTAEELDGIVTEWLEEHKEKKASGEAKLGEQDFMDVILSILNGANLAGFDADTVTKATCLVSTTHHFLKQIKNLCMSQINLIILLIGFDNLLGISLGRQNFFFYLVNVCFKSI